MKYGDGIVKRGNRKKARGHVESKSPQIAIRFDRDVFQKLLEKSETSGVTLASTVRSLVNIALVDAR